MAIQYHGARLPVGWRDSDDEIKRKSPHQRLAEGWNESRIAVSVGALARIEFCHPVCRHGGGEEVHL
ncbi:hypothetical protein VAWG007_04470 [Aeromonas enteropelogenes]|nr:hypothetical protein VAWG007_04470 [Aeromonas enteropelogenes]